MGYVRGMQAIGKGKPGLRGRELLEYGTYIEREVT